MAYICTSCNFRCNVKHTECPYCGKRTLEQEKSAEELLDDVDKVLHN